ncbi:general substrate transporter [Aulographum hederae CBS 113979]|uniref:General substrate transporter n=1 Tax=Aulographum hederae CBS 113979 TaxID=1176131 RepID=A0A6G1GUI3_9PEZI|nr:general substrate transporter [Aulographum hederae CBS 113979]
MGFMRPHFRASTLQWLLTISCSTSFCLYRYDAGVLGGVQETEPFHRALGYPTGTYVIPMLASSYTLAACVISLLLTTLGALQASAWSVPHMIVGRVISGFGIGCISCTIPMYQAEMSTEAKQRGPDCAVTCIWLVSGAAIAYWIDFGFTRMDNQISWRFPIGLQCLFAVVAGGCMLLLPDTPRWYYAKGRISEGDEVICNLYDADNDDSRVQEMKQSILASIQLEESGEHSFKLLDLIWDNSDLKAGRRIRISFLILSIQQMMGINLSVYYSTVIFSQVGLSPFLAQLLAAVMNTLFAAGTIPLVFTIERFGRRNILIYSAVALTVCMVIFVAMIGLPESTKSPATQWVAVAAIFVYNNVLGYGWIGVPWLYGPEIAPLKLRHAGAAAGAFGEWLFSFITVFAGGITLQNVGWKIWIWMALSCAVGALFAFFMCPETTGESLEEIDLIFAKDEIRNSAYANEVHIHSVEKSETVHAEKV